MTLAIEEVGLQHGSQLRLDAGMKIGLVSVREGRDGAPPTVAISTMDDSEHDFILHPGDTFPLGDQTWRLDHVKDAGKRNSTVILARIE